MNERRCYAYMTSLAASILLGMVFYQYPATQLAYAHTFSGNENAAFIATVGVIRTEQQEQENITTSADTGRCNNTT